MTEDHEKHSMAVRVAKSLDLKFDIHSICDIFDQHKAGRAEFFIKQDIYAIKKGDPYELPPKDRIDVRLLGGSLNWPPFGCLVYKIRLF